MDRLFRAHPWHGVPIGEGAPQWVNAYIEMVPTDTVKYELDKESGLLQIDRPQQYSSYCPSLYGFVPQTFCGEGIGAFCGRKMGLSGIVGDGDPLDICVFTEKTIPHGDILVRAIPIGGLRLLDGNEADDKIIAVLQGDLVYGSWTDLGDCPQSVMERLQHYFLTYKDIPGQQPRSIEMVSVYGAEEAREVICLSQEDYRHLQARKNNPPL